MIGGAGASTPLSGGELPGGDLAIRVERLCKRYPGRPPVDAVRGLTLSVRRGECFGLLGPNGAGKTTTVEILEGLLVPTSGEVEVLGMRWDRDAGSLRQRIGVSLQETRLSEKLTVGETIRLFRSFYAAGLPPMEALRLVGLDGKARARVGAISGGERQRLAVATAVVGWPAMVFLDEPTTGLDPQSRRQVWEIVEALRAAGSTVILTTHYMDEAERLCDRIAIVDAGRVIAEGTPAELVATLGGPHLVEVAARGSGDESLPIDLMRAIPGVAAATLRDELAVLATATPHTALPRVVALLEDRGFSLTRLTTRQASLDDVFLRLSGRHLAGEEP
jgi:ABC-2 type transport system ATP-binding protein